ncbi:hypothetical protein EJB05_21252, partial [Eragrostis curvula]
MSHRAAIDRGAVQARPNKLVRQTKPRLRVQAPAAFLAPSPFSQRRCPCAHVAVVTYTSCSRCPAWIYTCDGANASPTYTTFRPGAGAAAIWTHRHGRAPQPLALLPRRPWSTKADIVGVTSVLLLFVVLSVGFASLRRYYITSSDRRRPSGRRNRTARGVDPELLRSLPVTVYRAAAAKGSSDDEAKCAVCLAKLEDGEAARFLPRCGHGFHAGCVDMWLASHTTCPLCRLTIAKPDVTLPASALAPALPPVAPEPANYDSITLPASVLIGLPDHNQGAVNAASPSTDRVPATATLVIEIPKSAAPTPRD